MSLPRQQARLPYRQKASPSKTKSHSKSANVPLSVSGASFSSKHEWRTRPSIFIGVNNLPVGISAEYLWRWFQSEGTVTWIEIFSPKSGRGKTFAKVRFEPPPRRNFWRQGFVEVEHPDVQKYPEGLELKLTLMEERPSNDKAKDSKYPDKIVLILESLAFGSMLNPTLMRVMKSVHPPGHLPLELDFEQKIMTVLFSTISQTGRRKTSKAWKVRFQMSNIKSLMESTESNGVRHWVFTLPYPPEYFTEVDNILDTFRGNSQRWSATDTWCRATDIVGDNHDTTQDPIAIHQEVKDDMYIDIGRWTTFRLSFNCTVADNLASYSSFLSALKAMNVSLRPSCNFDTLTDATNLWDCLEDSSAIHTSQPSALLGMPQKVHLPFEVRYQLEVCVSRGILNEYAITIDFLQRLSSIPTIDATHRLEYLVDQNEKVVDAMDLFDIEDAKAYAPITKIPTYCTYGRKASITPTTIRFDSPTVETSNRVVRKYSQLQDRFLRVQFVEESELNRAGRNRQNNVNVWKRIERALFRGIRIGGRHYQFLAFGSSQLRQSSAYFFCPTDHVSCGDIRAWMGQLDHIKTVAKYAARLGQCFSTTRDVKGIWQPNIKQIDDIERDGQCFTDGVGKISGFLSKFIIDEMTLDVFNNPTAFQFRMGGCKGVLAVWPQAEKMEVHVRPSQAKFKSNFHGLEIVRCAAFSTATLNRQTITILESLGVPQKAFMKLLKDEIHSFEKAATDNSIAIDLLTKYVDENQSSLVLAELLKAEFKTDHTVDPFTLNLLNLWISWSFRLLREKARIRVPNSAFVLGCVDETGTLRGHSKDTEGSPNKDTQKLPQIFLQFTNPRYPIETTIVKGLCIVGRNPSLHPGDIRVVQAVDNPNLRHLKDVVVFPSKGDRPVPAMLSGGDLDGDDFFIIWDPDLLPKEWNYKPMDYSAPHSHELDRDVSVDDMRKFFVNYMKNDVLALIATAHLGFADEHGPKSSICLELAGLHSQAVDYAKTGVPAEFSSRLQQKRWPHFMEKKSSYRSKKALGALYDEVVKHSFQFNPDWEHSFDKRVLERYALEDDILTAAEKIKGQYDAAVRRLLVQHNVETEFELYTGWVMSSTKVSSDYKRQEDLGREFDALKQRFREQCCSIAGGTESPQLDKFVAAMYKVTATQVKEALNYKEDATAGDTSTDLCREPKFNTPLISFPWIFHWVMIRLAMGDKYRPGKSVLAAARRSRLFNHPHLPQSNFASVTTMSSVDESSNNDRGDSCSATNAGEPLSQQTTNGGEVVAIQTLEMGNKDDSCTGQDGAEDS